MSTHLMETPLVTALQLVQTALASLQQNSSSPSSPATADANTQAAISKLELATTLLGGLDPYLDSVSSKGPAALQALIDETDRHDWKAAYESKKVSFQVHPGWSAGGYEGSFIAMVARSIKAKRVLEVGMFTGTTTLCVADALPQDGKLVTLEIDSYFKDLATPYFEKAGVASRIDVRIGSALESIKKMAQDKEEPFDLIFIDADKTGYHDYYETILGSGLLRQGGVLLVDNTLYKGVPFTPALEQASAETVKQLQLNLSNGIALKKFNQHVAQDSRVEASVLPIRDGVTWIMHRNSSGA
ncbi:hypothetical protein OC834_004783 [Tilletia horrida]|nr:hypothetical protein OC834_004783 [Tilletia horrida]